MIRPSRKGWGMLTDGGTVDLGRPPDIPQKSRGLTRQPPLRTGNRARGTSRGSHQLGEGFGDLRVFAFRETNPDARLVAVAQLQLAERTVPRVIIGRCRKCEIPAMA